MQGVFVQAPVFRAKYRARFLQLADIFLSSGMVPAYTAAAFIKKFARLALTAPPAGELIIKSKSLLSYPMMLKLNIQRSNVANRSKSEDCHSADCFLQLVIVDLAKGQNLPLSKESIMVCHSKLSYLLREGLVLAGSILQHSLY